MAGYGKRSKHSLSNYKLLSCKMGDIVPIGLTEVLPGDSFQHATSLFVRASPLLAPVMHPVHTKVHHWFVPHRLVWDNFEDFITGGPDGENADTVPKVETPATTGFAVGSLADYLGVTPGKPDAFVSALPFRAYGLIFNEYYRDQDLVAPVVVSTANGPDTTTNTSLLKAAWEKDYFTSSRLEPQKGPDVVVPLSGSLPVKGIGKQNQTFAAGPSGTVYETGGTTANYADYSNIGNEADDIRFRVVEDLDHPGYPGIYAQLSGAGIDVNTLRASMAIQRFQESRARFGSRYSEYLRYLGVRSSDARLQRPEYCGGGVQTLQFSEVLQTGVTTSGSAAGVGNLRGHGVAAMRSNRYRRFFEEHGYLISVMITRPKAIYADGVPRTWLRETNRDFWQKEYQHIGQQQVDLAEVWLDSATQGSTFGYQDRYDEYRRAESSIAGEFRTTDANFWHFARIFASQPELNDDFVTCDAPVRPFQVTNKDTLYVMAKHSLQARRLVCKTGSSFIF